MSDNTTERLNFKVISTGRPEVDNRVPCNLNILTMEKLFIWIDNKSIDSRLKQELKKMVSTWPQQALETWQKNYQRYLSKAQNKLKDIPFEPEPLKYIYELGDEPDGKTENEKSFVRPPIPEEFE